MRLRGFVAVVAALALFTPEGNAWWDGGHEAVAYIAYQRLTPATRARMDALLQRNPMYASWTMGIAPDKLGLVAFVKRRPGQTASNRQLAPAAIPATAATPPRETRPMRKT